MSKIPKDVCQFCNKQDKTEIINFYYWRIRACEECENKARKNGHIK